MKHFIFSHDAEKAAQEFASTKGIHFDMVPECIGANPRFWIELVKLNPEYIARVPQKVLEQPEFAENVDHQTFYRYIPKEYLTVKDYNTFKEMPEKSISVNRNPVKLSHDNEFSWYCTDDLDRWIGESSLNKYRLLDLIEEGRGADRINKELWSQDFADYLWESRKAIVAFDNIPEEFVRDEWRKLMTFFKERRYPILGYVRGFEKVEQLPEYWASFKTAEDMILALECEEFVERCQNPWGYTEVFEFNSARREKIKTYPQIFANLWKAVEEVARDNPEILKKMVSCYGSWFAKCMPKELFNLEWLIDLELVELYASSYTHALSRLNLAKSEVERMEAEDRLKEVLEDFKKEILIYVSLNDEELNQFIERFV